MVFPKSSPSVYQDRTRKPPVNRRHPLHEVIASTAALVAVVGFLALIIFAG